MSYNTVNKGDILEGSGRLGAGNLFTKANSLNESFRVMKMARAPQVKNIIHLMFAYAGLTEQTITFKNVLFTRSFLNGPNNGGRLIWETSHGIEVYSHTIDNSNLEYLSYRSQLSSSNWSIIDCPTSARSYTSSYGPYFIVDNTSTPIKYATNANLSTWVGLPGWTPWASSSSTRTIHKIFRIREAPSYYAPNRGSILEDIFYSTSDGYLYRIRNRENVSYTYFGGKIEGGCILRDWVYLYANTDNEDGFIFRINYDEFFSSSDWKGSSAFDIFSSFRGESSNNSSQKHITSMACSDDYIFVGVEENTAPGSLWTFGYNDDTQPYLTSLPASFKKYGASGSYDLGRSWVAYGNGIYVAAFEKRYSDYPFNIFYSRDGQNWDPVDVSGKIPTIGNISSEYGSYLDMESIYAKTTIGGLTYQEGKFLVVFNVTDPTIDSGTLTSYILVLE